MEIRTLDDLKHIAGKKPDNVTFMLPFLDDQKNSYWSNEFNNLLKDCGCSSGQQYMLYTTPFYIIIMVVLTSFTLFSKKALIIIFIAALIITGLTGKIAGIIQRNHKIQKLVKNFYLKNKIEEES